MMELMKTPEWKKAKKIVEDWMKNQLRKEGRDGIYIDDEAVLIHEISKALVKAKK